MQTCYEKLAVHTKVTYPRIRSQETKPMEHGPVSTFAMTVKGSRHTDSIFESFLYKLRPVNKRVSDYLEGEKKTCCNKTLIRSFTYTS